LSSFSVKLLVKEIIATLWFCDGSSWDS